jgi:hypothetical protein
VSGVTEVLLGIVQRGRLNVPVNLLGKVLADAPADDPGERLDDTDTHLFG